MNKYNRILKGTLKGKVIPLPKKIKNHQNCTPQKIKEAIFQVTENYFHPQTTLFWDTFSGSGQIGFESISRDFIFTVISEVDKERVKNIKKWLSVEKIETNNLISSKNSLQSISWIFTLYPDIKNYIVFMDPPYSFYLDDKKQYKNSYLIDKKPKNLILEMIHKIQIIKKKHLIDKNILIILQIPKRNQAVIQISIHELLNTEFSFKVYKYGNHSLLVYFL